MAEDLGAAVRTSGGILSWAGAEGSGVWFAFGEEHSALCRVRMNCWGPCGQGRPTEKVPATGPGGRPGEDWGAKGVLAGAGGVCISRRTVGGEEVGVAEAQRFGLNTAGSKTRPPAAGSGRGGLKSRLRPVPGILSSRRCDGLNCVPSPKSQGKP